MFGFGMESVYVGRSMRDFSAVREALSSRGIDYKYKVNNRQAAWLFPAGGCLLYTSPSPRDRQKSRMPSSA